MKYAKSKSWKIKMQKIMEGNKNGKGNKGKKHSLEHIQNHANKLRKGYLHDGYLVVTLWNKEKKVHRLIWEKENGKIPEGLIVHHKDGNKLNNSIENLELLTRNEHSKLHNKERKLWKK